MTTLSFVEVVLADGNAIKLEQTAGKRYVHQGDVFNVWAQNISFNQKENFEQNYQDILAARGERLNDPQVSKISWRAHVATSLATMAKERGRTFVECGVHLGLLSNSICKTLEHTGTGKLENFYLFDTYTNIPTEQFDESSEPIAKWHNENNYLGDNYDYIKGEFSKYPYVNVVKGKIPEILSQYENINDVSYLSIDLNILYPEKAALEFFWPRVISGGVILIDDYGFANHRLQQEYYDNFCREHALIPCHLPTGQAIIMKP